MSKQLLIMRHAKSSWNNSQLSDHQRPLNGRGRVAAPKMARWLIEQQLVPDYVLTSTAVRALTTAQILITEFSLPNISLQVEERLYHGTPDDYLHQLTQLPETIRRPLVVGHNPGLEELVYSLTGTMEFMSPAAIAQVVLPIEEWSQLKNNPSGHELLGIHRPKDLFGD